MFKLLTLNVIPQATVAPYTGQTPVTAVWYLSDSTSTGSARTTYLEGLLGWPSGATPSGTDGSYTPPVVSPLAPAQYTIHTIR